MTEEIDRTRFEQMAADGGDRAVATSLAASARGGDHTGAADLAALMVHVAMVAPEGLPEVYDGATEGWSASAASAAPLLIERPADDEPPTAQFWHDFWALVLDPEVGRNAGEITVRTAALAAHTSDAFRARLAAATLHYPGVTDALAAGDPTPFTMPRWPPVRRVRWAATCTT